MVQKSGDRQLTWYMVNIPSFTGFFYIQRMVVWDFRTINKNRVEMPWIFSWRSSRWMFYMVLSFYWRCRISHHTNTKKNSRWIGSFPQVGVEINNCWNHNIEKGLAFFTILDLKRRVYRYTLQGTNSEFTPKNWCLGNKRFLLGKWHMFMGELLVSGRVYY